MRQKVRGTVSSILAMGFTFTGVMVLPCFTAAAPPTKFMEIAGVSNSPMGAYRALAQLTLQAFQKGDMPTAAELARILERTWDGAEGGGGPRSLQQRNKELFEQIDHAMDAYIKPVIYYSHQTPDHTTVQSAYNNYVAKLTEADSSP